MKKDPYAPLRHAETPAASPKAWRSIAHLEQRPEVVEDLDVEFPNGLAPDSAVSRREAMKLAGASIALGTLAGCVRRPKEEILPFNKQPEAVIPGVKLTYASAHPRPDGAVGVIVEANQGRPTKLEGNPKHPGSLGASDTWMQAEILKLYDPDRARAPLKAGAPSTWEAWDAFAKDHFGRLVTEKGKGLALVVDHATGPTLDRLLGEALKAMPEAKLYRYDPLAPDGALAAAERVFGVGARAHFDLTKADVIFALDADFLVAGPEHIRLAREFGQRRTVVDKADAARMNRLYVAEGVFSTTGANADHRVRVASAECGALLKALAHELVKSHAVSVSGAEPLPVSETPPPAGADKFIKALASDLAAHRGAAVVIAGERQPVEVQAYAHAINVALSAPMKVSREPEARPHVSSQAALAELTRSLMAGEVFTLVMLDVNPVYTAPGAMKFQDALAKAATVIHAGVLPDETSALASWHLPLAHFLEAWGDARAFDGTAALVQPLILPLFGARAATTLVAQLAGMKERADLALLEQTWRGPAAPLANASSWRKALRDGVIPATAYATEAPKVVEGAMSAIGAAVRALASAAPSAQALEVVALKGNLLDGRLSNVSWLQELPDSMSKLVWDNAILVSPALAREAGLRSENSRNGYEAEVVTLTSDGRSITAPTFVLPGLAKYTVAVLQGYGRTVGEVGKGVGVPVNPLLSDLSGVVSGVRLTKAGRRQVLCSTQDHFSVPADPFRQLTFAEMSGAEGKLRELGLGSRPLYLEAEAKAVGTDAGITKAAQMPANLVEPSEHPSRPARPKQLTDEIVYEGQQWGMTIDLTSCIGCNACTVACVAENNIPVVGREQVLLGREMHWIRLDRYFMGDIDDPQAGHQPLPCMHCENAPCEPVCPVAATVHDEEGLNSMAYNRCVGTRYCANNCPYKVRRFNYLDYTTTGNISVDAVQAERMRTQKLQRNPDVTVRYRGVMEKCTFCTQRIEEAKIVAKRQGKDRKALPDGAVTPACAQACPTQAIAFGNINDPSSRVAKLKASERNYEMLQELNTRPRTTYLARLRNGNEELA